MLHSTAIFSVPVPGLNITLKIEDISNTCKSMTDDIREIILTHFSSICVSSVNKDENNFEKID